MVVMPTCYDVEIPDYLYICFLVESRFTREFDWHARYDYGNYANN